MGYDAAFLPKRASRIAVLAAGYGDGIHRSLGNRGNVLVRGVLAPIVGIVSMDVTMIDVTDVPGVAVGDTATIYGVAGGEVLSGERGGAEYWDGHFGFAVRGDAAGAAGLSLLTKFLMKCGGSS